MRTKKIIFIISLLYISVTFCYARQYSGAEADAARRNQQAEELRRQEIRDLEQRRRNLDNLLKIKSASRTVAKKKELSERDKTLRKKMTAPDADDLILLQDFLKQSGTGIFRLFPDYDCVAKDVVRVSGNCENIFPGTGFYSFRRKDYSDDVLFDIQLKDGNLVADGFLSLGILTHLGNFSLDDVSLESKGGKFINDFIPTEKSADVKTQYAEFGKGIESDGYRYAREVEVKLGEIYLMRVIAYRLQRKLTERIPYLGNVEAEKLSALEDDVREDITIAFRIIRKNRNGSLTIISKELARKKSPSIIFAEK